MASGGINRRAAAGGRGEKPGGEIEATNSGMERLSERRKYRKKKRDCHQWTSILKSRRKSK
jgi:hypothetical protein